MRALLVLAGVITTLLTDQSFNTILLEGESPYHTLLNKDLQWRWWATKDYQHKHQLQVVWTSIGGG